MDSTLKTKKTMSNDEVALLIDIIQSKPILTSKETNATTNKIKEDAWTSLASIFNARSGSIPRTKKQLKFKWDNLKKAARKRSQQIRMNNSKTGGGKSEFIPPDDNLDKVSELLGSTCTGFAVPFGEKQAKKRKFLFSPGAAGSKYFFRMPMSKPLRTTEKGKTNENKERQARDLAITKYYEKKTEKLDLEIKLLKLELAIKENENLDILLQ